MGDLQSQSFYSSVDFLDLSPNLGMEAMNEEIVYLLEVRLYIKFLIILDE